MDELELLKQKWQAREQDLPTLSYNDIYKLILKKSSSIVKWIFIIGVLELCFWIGLVLLTPESQMKVMNDMGLKTASVITNIIHFAIIAVFIWYFYRNYRSIQVTDNTKMLMKNILKTRKTVRYFVFYNLAMYAVSSIVIVTYFYMNSGRLYSVMDFASRGISPENFDNRFLIGYIIVSVLFIGILMLFYWLIYGILLGRLKRNYKELKRMEV